ncbi:MAG TPA: glycosyltransferase [Polyangiaceae bacterium]|nr:glycosyltransferase [Polyangiaceae bacterium]
MKFIDMMSPRGHELIHYGNEGSIVPCEHVQMLFEEERAGWFGPHDPSRLYDLDWNPSQPYWQTSNERALRALQRRTRAGDFILTLAGNCQQPIGDGFEGSYASIPTGPMMVEYGIGYYGTFSRYRVFESHAHREWWHGRRDNVQEDNDDAVVPNYFDRRDFPSFPRDEEEKQALLRGLPERSRERVCSIVAEPYFLFLGRIIASKGFHIAIETTAALGSRLVLAGQGDPGPLPPHVVRFGHATIEERGVLMACATASFAPTHYREPFGGVAVEAQLCGTPAVTTDHGAFVETVEAPWRCASHAEFLEAAERARQLRAEERAALRERALSRYSLEAVAPLYERYFSRLYARWGGGWYETRDLSAIALPRQR